MIPHLRRRGRVQARDQPYGQTHSWGFQVDTPGHPSGRKQSHPGTGPPRPSTGQVCTEAVCQTTERRRSRDRGEGRSNDYPMTPQARGPRRRRSSRPGARSGPSRDACAPTLRARLGRWRRTGRPETPCGLTARGLTAGGGGGMRLELEGRGLDRQALPPGHQQGGFRRRDLRHLPSSEDFRGRSGVWP